MRGTLRRPAAALALSGPVAPLTRRALEEPARDAGRNLAASCLGLTREHPDLREPPQSVGLSIRWIVAGLVVLFIAYGLGRAAGILLDLNPYVTETAAMVTVAMVAAWMTARRRN